MPAYLHAEIVVTDPVAYQAYVRQTPAVIAAHGGRFLARGGAAELLEGDKPLGRQVILEFQDRASLDAFYASADYQRLIALRRGCSVSRLVAVDGI